MICRNLEGLAFICQHCVIKQLPLLTNRLPIPSPNYSASKQKLTAHTPNTITPGCIYVSLKFSPVQIFCQSWLLWVPVGFTNTWIHTANVWWGPLCLLTLSASSQCSLWLCWNYSAGLLEGTVFNLSACQRTNVILTVSAISLITICTCLECPHVDVCSWGAYSRQMHAEGNHWERRGSH